TAKFYIDKIDEKALDKDDFPFYIYLKANIFNNISLKKLLATEYIYDRNYGYKTFVEIYKKLSQKELQKAVDILISKRMYKRALDIMPLLKSSNKNLYYYLYLNVKIKDIKRAKYYLSQINPDSKWYAVGLYILGYYAKSWKERKYYFKQLLNTKNHKYIKKLGTVLMKKAFHYKKNDYFLYFKKFLPLSEEKVWYTFLYKYFYKNKKIAYRYLLKNKDFIKNKNKLNYWLYLSSKNKKYLYKVRNSKKMDFYKVISANVIKTYPHRVSLKKNRLIEILKKNGDLYKWAYREANYFYKKTGNLDYLKQVMPEVIVRSLTPDERYIKPFGSLNPLVYAIMKQESLFYYKAISFSNAVGLMQFVPKTAYWTAQKRKDKYFDITHMFNPYISIDYGRWYLKYLLNMFNGNVFYTVASYNGGATNVKKTLKRFNPKNIAEFVETHPFDETRDYVKKVYTNYVIYKKLSEDKVVYRAH
ncbi:lytic transglycosylase domain-containing protein, partial [Hydrogenivirga sp. 128-5-R1-1]|uniref:lytic transglycosylase domain-containing protein n=1 Tax=Hydrogenivirga sp. 128-5-R1-1 TaxID=392423 RepID=UPI00015F22D4